MRARSISIKNGGGIRELDRVDRLEAGQELPPAANPDAGKQAGEVSQLDIENSLRFNNALSLVTLTPQQLLEALENGVSNPGGIFAQVGGLRFSYDLTRPAGDRVRSVALVDENGEVTDVIVRNGEVVADAPSAIRMVTLSFLIGGRHPHACTPRGFNRPDGFRFAEYIAANPTFANRVDLDPDSSGADDVAARTGVATFTDNGREQDALAEYMAAQILGDAVHPGGHGSGAGQAHPERRVPRRHRSRQRSPGHRRRPRRAVDEGQTVVITTADLTEADPDHSGARSPTP